MSAKDPVTRCQNCGKVIEEGRIYCQSCKTLLDELLSSIKSGMLSNVRSLEDENLELHLNLWKARKRPSNIIGLFLLTLGFAGLATSIIYQSNTLAFIGLGLTFWGALLMYTRPGNYVRGELLEAMIKTYYISIQRFINQIGYLGEPIYLPPTRLRSFTSGAVFIGAENSQDAIESILADGISGDEAFTPLPNGICIVPPGLDLANLLEVQIKKNFSRVDLGFIQSTLPGAIIDSLELAEGIEIEINGEEITMKVKNSIYESLYKQDFDDRIKRLGCPLVSSIALALTRSTGKPVIIKEIRSESNNNTITVLFGMMSGVA